MCCPPIRLNLTRHIGLLNVQLQVFPPITSTVRRARFCVDLLQVYDCQTKRVTVDTSSQPGPGMHQITTSRTNSRPTPDLSQLLVCTDARVGHM